jgi:hypothetical protein
VKRSRQFRQLNRPAKSICPLALVLALGLPAYGTAISFLVERDAIFVATDGRSTSHVKVGSPILGMTCKLYRMGDWVFAASGVAVNVAARFDVYKLARTSLNNQRTADAGMEALKTTTLKYLQNVASDSERTDPKDYALWITGKTPVVSLAIGGIETGTARLLVCEFFLKTNGTANIPKCETLIGNNNGAEWWGMGSNEMTKSFLERNAADAARAIRTNPLGFLKTAIEREIAGDLAAGGTDVGLPITTARFDSAGLHFVEPGACEVQGNKTK